MNPRRHPHRPVIVVSDPTVVVGALDNSQAEAPTGVYALVVTALATTSQLSVLLDTLTDGAAEFVLTQGGAEIWRENLPVADINQLVANLNSASGRLQVHSDGVSLIVSSDDPGTSEALAVTIGGSKSRVHTVQVASDATVTLDGTAVGASGNTVQVAGLELTLLSAGKANITIADRKAPTWIYPLVLGYLVLLMVLPLLYKTEPGHLFRGVPSSIGPVPLSVPLFGALGAVVISLDGLFIHNRSWLPSYNFWHVARPFLGAVLGFVAVLIFVALIDATQASSSTASSTTTSTTLAASSNRGGTSSGTAGAVSTTVPTTTATTNPKNNAPGSAVTGGLSSVIVFDVLAFLVGYREQTFRDLLTRVTDVLLGPGGVGAEGSSGTTTA